MATEKEEKTSMGFKEGTAAALSYALGWVSGLIFYLVEKENKFVRFHAMQSIALSVVLTAFWIALGIMEHIPYIGIVIGFVSSLAGLGVFVLWIVLMVKASKKEMFKLPVIGDFAEKQSS